MKKWYDKDRCRPPDLPGRAYSLLRAILASVVDKERLKVNTARVRGAGAGQVDRQHRVRPATLDQLALLTQAMPPRYRLLVELAASLRFAELTELRRGDVDTRDAVPRGFTAPLQRHDDP